MMVIKYSEISKIVENKKNISFVKDVDIEGIFSDFSFNSIDEETLKEYWQESVRKVIGEGFEKDTEPASFKKNILRIRVISSVIKAHFFQQKALLLQELSRYPYLENLKDIRFNHR